MTSSLETPRQNNRVYCR